MIATAQDRRHDLSSWSGQQRRRCLHRGGGDEEDKCRLFPSPGVDPLSQFLRSLWSRPVPLWYRFPSAHRRARAKEAPVQESQSRRGGPGRKSQVGELTQLSPPPISASLDACSSSWALSQLPLPLPLSLSLSLSRDPDHPRQRARCPRSNGTKPGRKRSHSSGETKLEEKVQRRPAIAPAPPAALNQRAKRARAASSLFLFYVPAASLAALGPVDRVPGVLHHGERTTKRKHERNVSLKGVVRRGERAAAAFFFFFFFPFFERASSRTHKKTRQAVRPTTLSRSFFFL